MNQASHPRPRLTPTDAVKIVRRKKPDDHDNDLRVLASSTECVKRRHLRLRKRNPTGRETTRRRPLRTPAFALLRPC